MEKLSQHFREETAAAVELGIISEVALELDFSLNYCSRVGQKEMVSIIAYATEANILVLLQHTLNCKKVN